MRQPWMQMSNGIGCLNHVHMGAWRLWYWVLEKFIKKRKSLRLLASRHVWQWVLGNQFSNV
eukprot:1161411-Pelagomonas_calceolata.AAC.5